MQLTDRQQEVLDFILNFRQQNGCSPSIPEIQRHFGWRSPNGVTGHLQALEAKGAIRRSGRGSRQVDVVNLPPVELLRDRLHPVPMFGTIPAGAPQAREPANPEACAYLDESILGFKPTEGCFALRVRGDSMKEAGILNGDIVVIQPSPAPREGQIVAALIDGECTLKRLIRMHLRWYLKAENPAYPELQPREMLLIQGVVRTVIRQFD